MQELKVSWNTEELVSKMESQQKEIDRLDEQIMILETKNHQLSSDNQTLLHKTQLLQQENQELKKQIQQLSSGKSKLQSAIQDLMKELQQKSDQIVKLSSADLILKENEKLKEKDRKRENEMNEIKRKSEEAVQACKTEYEGKGQLLDYYTDLEKKKVIECNRKIEEQDKLIDEYAEQKFKKNKSSLEKMYRKKNHELNAAYTARNTALLSQLFSSIIYAAVVTLLTAAKSKTFINDIKDFFISFANILMTISNTTINVGKSAAVICYRIDNPTVQNVLYWIMTMLIAMLLTGLPILIAYFLVKKYILWYKEEICDSISLWMVVITLAITIFLSDEVKILIPINLIVINIITHLTYSGFRAYYRGCKKNRGYY